MVTCSRYLCRLVPEIHRVELLQELFLLKVELVLVNEEDDEDGPNHKHYSDSQVD